MQVYDRKGTTSNQVISTLLYFAVCFLFLDVAYCRCRYDTSQNMMPFAVDTPAFQLGNQLTACRDFIEPGRLGCCNHYNDQVTAKNFDQINSIFGVQGGGCDICAINLKRFWCHYACSARQDEFMEVSEKYYPFDDPQKPGTMITAQKVTIRVHADTGCALYNSCKRNPFVASVSAMGSTAGFLNFQGHNAIDGGRQYISVNFSNNLNDSLAFSDSLNDFPYQDLTLCNYTTKNPEIHNFTFSAECKCNSCDLACEDDPDSFKYTEADLLEGFNFELVGIVYGVVIGVAVLLTIYRSCRKKMKRQ